jgi:hypothetical protein
LLASQTKNKDASAMPHPKNRLKLTGDTHLPDVPDMLDDLDEADPDAAPLDAGARVYADGWVAPPPDAASEEMHHLPEPVMQAERQLRRQVGSTPWLAVGAALGVGFLVARMLRR